MDRLRQWLVPRERGAIFIALLALFMAVYFGAALVPPWRTPSSLPWDPVWRIPFVPIFILPYISAYVMPLIAFAIPYERMAFRRMALAYAGAIVVAGAGFILVPLAPPHPADVGSGALGALVRMEYAIDVTRNLFPSLHVAISFLNAFAVARFLPRRRLIAFLWAGLIAASTLFVRQHFAIDVAGGLLLAIAAWRIAFPKPRGA